MAVSFFTSKVIPSHESQSFQVRVQLEFRLVTMTRVFLETTCQWPGILGDNMARQTTAADDS
jgi:hypothetical protein